jgi:hypothetical protein
LPVDNNGKNDATAHDRDLWRKPVDEEVRRRLTHSGREDLQKPERRIYVGNFAGTELSLQ